MVFAVVSAEFGKKVADKIINRLSSREIVNREQALIKFLVSGLIFGALIYGLLNLPKYFEGSEELRKILLMPTAILGFPSIVLLTEFIFGISARDLSKKRNLLKGYERLILGLIVVAIAIAFGRLIFCIPMIVDSCQKS